jgi:transposase
MARTSVCLWLQHWREERHCQAKRHRGGLKPVIRDKAEAALIRLVQADNDLILAEYRDRLAEETGVWVHPWIIGRVLHCLAWTSQKEDLACH